jgi:hypothetical protein
VSQQRIIWGAILVWFAAVAARAQTPDKPDAEVEKLGRSVETFLDTAGRSTNASNSTQLQSAFQQLLQSSPLAAQTASLSGLTEKTLDLKTKYGEFRTWERIAAKRVGNDVVVLRYLYKCASYPVVWHVTYYRPPPASGSTLTTDETWRVIAVRFDTDLEALAK